MSAAIAGIVLLPFAGAVTAFLAGERVQRLIGMVVAAGTPLAGFSLALHVWRKGPQRYAVGGWEPPLGITLYADGSGVFMLLVTGIVAALASLYCLGYYGPDTDGSTGEARLFWPLWLFLWASMNVLFLAADVFNTYVAFELIGLSAIALITITGAAKALAAAMRYVIVAFLGSLSYLMGVALLYGESGTLDMLQLAAELESGTAVSGACALITIGLLLKTALFPMHFWLPPAHANAVAPVSAVLSALVVKASFFILVRLWFSVFSDTVNISAGTLLGVLGSVAILWGSFRALQQKKLKLLIAHSTVAQVGYLFLLFPLMSGSAPPGSAGWIQEAWTGAFYQVLAHALAKAALFLAAGVVLCAYATDKLIDICGLHDRLPLTTFSIGVAGVSLMGLPPSGGFAAKWLIMKAAIASGQWWWIPVIVLGGLLTAAYVVHMLRYAFQAGETPHTIKPVSRTMEIAAFALAVLSILIGFRLEEPFQLLTVGAPFSPEVHP